MPTHSFGAVQEDPRKLDKIPFAISSELKSKGKSFAKKKDGTELTDSQFVNAQVLTAGLASPVFSLVTPPVANQGGEGSCCAFAVGYYQLSIEWYYKKLASSFSNTVNVFSPEYLFDLVTTSLTCSGSGLITNSRFVQNNGCVLYNTMPYVDGTCASFVPSSPQVTEAALYKPGVLNQIPIIDKAGIKAALLGNHPVVTQIAADQQFYTAGPGFIWNSFTGVVGYHAIAFVGYDDTKNAYKIVNSWGTSWGDAGYSYIDYDFAATVCSDVLFYTGNAPSNTLPVANAGFDQSAKAGASVSLDGTASYDPDGTINAWLWSQVSGPNTATISNSTSPVAVVGNLIAGSYVFKLQVTDNTSATAIDTVAVTVTSTVSDTVDLVVTKTISKGKTTDILTWNIVVGAFPQSASIEYSASPTSGFANVYNIQPYLPNSSWTRLAGTKNTRYYRLKVVKSDGTTAYSAVSSIK